MRMHQSKYSYNSASWDHLPVVQSWNKPNVLILAFCSPEVGKQSEPIRELARKFHFAQVVGCSTSGEIQGEHIFDRSICVTFIEFEKSGFKSIVMPLNHVALSQQVGAKIASALFDDNLKGVLVLSEGLNANGSDIVAGFNSVINANIPIGGGLAGDSTDFKTTFIIDKGEVKYNHVVAIGFYGNELNVVAGSKGGWVIFGPERTITKSQGNILYEIDGKPALELYKEYLGEKSKDLPSSGLLFPLQIHPPDHPDKKLVRTILNIDEKSNSLIFAGNIPLGWIAQLMRADFERVIEASHDVFHDLHQNNSNSNPELIVAVSCVGRRLVLGERCEEEIEALSSLSVKNRFVTGFYSYGEMSPLVSGGPCELHNQTMTLFVMNESNTKRNAA